MAKTKNPGRIRAALSILWRGQDLGDPLEYEDVRGSDSAGQAVNQKTVLLLSAAWACTRLISETIATLPLHVYERTGSGRRIASEHPLYPLLKSRPNVRSTAATMWQATVAAMALQGNGYLEARKVGNKTAALYFIDEKRLRKTGKKNVYSYTDIDGKTREIRKENICKFPGFSLDGYNGVSVIRYGASVFGAALAANSAANGVFKDGLHPKPYFKVDRILKADQRSEYRKNLKEAAGAAQAGDPLLLEGGMEPGTLVINPKDAQLLEVRQFSVEELCRWFRVDPSMVGHGGKDSNWGTGLEQKMLAFLTFTLRPWLTSIEQVINTWLMPLSDQGRYFAEFSIEGLLRADSKARAEFYQIMTNIGAYSRDDVREKENLPMKGGNASKLTVNSATTLLDDLGKKPEQP